MKILVAMLAVAILAGSAFGDGITVNASVKLVAGAISQQQSSGDVALTNQNAAPLFAGNAMTLTTNWSPIGVGSVELLGYGWFKNASTSCTVRVGITNAAAADVVAFMEMNALNIALLPLATNGVFYAQAILTVQNNGTNAPTTNSTATLIPYVQTR